MVSRSLVGCDGERLEFLTGVKPLAAIRGDRAGVRAGQILGEPFLAQAKQLVGLA